MNPLNRLRALLQSGKPSTVSTVKSGSGLNATVSGNSVHEKAMKGDTLLAIDGKVVRLPRAPAAIQK